MGVLFADGRDAIAESSGFDSVLHPRTRAGEFARKFGVFKHSAGSGHVVRELGDNGRAANPYHDMTPVSVHSTERSAHVAANELNGVKLPPPAPRIAHPEGYHFEVAGTQMTISVPSRPSVESGGPREELGFRQNDRVVLPDGREGSVLGPGRRHGDGEVSYSVHAAVKRADPMKPWKTTEQVTAKHSELSYHPDVMAERHASAAAIAEKAAKGGMPLGSTRTVDHPVTLGPHIVPAGWQVEHGYAEYVSNSMHRNPSEGDEVAVMPNAPAHGGKRGVVVQASDKDPVTGFYRGGAEHPGSQVNPLIRFEGEQEPVAVRSRDLYRGAERTPPTRLKPGTDVERMIFHHMAGRPAPANPAPGTAAYEQWTYGMKGKGSTKRPGNKAERAALISKLTQAANASDSVERARRLVEAEAILRRLPVEGVTVEEIEIMEAAYNPSRHPRGRGGKWVEVLGRQVFVKKGEMGHGSPHEAYVSDHLPDIAGTSHEIEQHKHVPLGARLDYQHARSEALAASGTQGFEGKAKAAHTKLDVVREHRLNAAVSLSHATPEEFKQAFEAWNTGQAYVDNNGNYRLRNEGKKVAPWNRAVKQAFPDAMDFHAAAHLHSGGKVTRGGREISHPMVLARPVSEAIEESLLLARPKTRGGVEMATHVDWNPLRHPRGRHGQFADVLNAIGKGHEVTLPHGVTVKRSLLGFHVQGPNGRKAHSFDAEQAAKRATEFSADEARAQGQSHVVQSGNAWRTGREHLIDDMWRGGKREEILDRLDELTPGHTTHIEGHQVTRGFGDESHVYARQFGGKLLNRGTADEIATAIHGKSPYTGGDSEDVLGRAVAARRAVASPGLADSGPVLDDAARERVAAQGREADAAIERFKSARRAAGVPDPRSVASRREKVKALIDSGLATDAADARAQLADMGEMPGEVGSAAHVAATAGRAAAARRSAILPSPAMRRTNERLAQLREIVRSHQHQEIDGVLVDAQTANLLLKLHGSLNGPNQEKFGSIPLSKLADFAYKRAR